MVVQFLSPPFSCFLFIFCCRVLDFSRRGRSIVLARCWISCGRCLDFSRRGRSIVPARRWFCCCRFLDLSRRGRPVVSARRWISSPPGVLDFLCRGWPLMWFCRVLQWISPTKGGGRGCWGLVVFGVRRGCGRCPLFLRPRPLAASRRALSIRVAGFLRGGLPFWHVLLPQAVLQRCPPRAVCSRG